MSMLCVPAHWMGLPQIPMMWRVGILIAAMLHFLVSLAFERYGLPLMVSAVSRYRKKRRHPARRRLYKRLREQPISLPEDGDDAALAASASVSIV